ncbi:MAG TPA: hypothetical protein VIY86_15290, partial [Pirellulaceae bacterium]
MLAGQDGCEVIEMTLLSKSPLSARNRWGEINQAMPISGQRSPLGPCLLCILGMVLACDRPERPIRQRLVSV